MTLLFFLWSCKPLQLLQSFNSSTGDPELSPMVGCEHLPLYLSGSGRGSQETDILGFHQQALPSIHNIIWFWLLYMGWIPRWSSLWMAFASVSAPHFVSIFPSMSILFTLLRGYAPTNISNLPPASGSGRVSLETAISSSCQHVLLGIYNSVWVW